MTVFLNQPWRRIGLPLLLSGLILSCSPLNPFGLASDEYVSIDRLSQLSNQKVVYIKGIVVNLAPFLEGGAYQLQDATGSVWIKTDKSLPKKGTALTVKGELAYQAIFVGQDQLGESYVLEIEQQPETASVILPPSASHLTNNSEGQAQIESPKPFPEPSQSPSPISNPSPSPTAASIPVPTPGAKPASKAPSSLPVQSSPKPTSNIKFDPDEHFLPHKQLVK